MQGSYETRPCIVIIRECAHTLSARRKLFRLSSSTHTLIFLCIELYAVLGYFLFRQIPLNLEVPQILTAIIDQPFPSKTSIYNFGRLIPVNFPARSSEIVGGTFVTLARHSLKY